MGIVVVTKDAFPTTSLTASTTGYSSADCTSSPLSDNPSQVIRSLGAPRPESAVNGAPSGSVMVRLQPEIGLRSSTSTARVSTSSTPSPSGENGSGDSASLTRGGVRSSMNVAVLARGWLPFR